MNRSVRRAAIAVADAATEGLDMTTVLIGGAIGAWAGYTYYPDTWSGDWRLVATGAVAVVAAVAINGMADLFITPLRRLISKARHTRPQTSAYTAPPAPDTLDEGLAQVVAATEDDAAHRAASAAFHIDRGDNFLAGREPVARLRERRGVLPPRPRRVAPLRQHRRQVRHARPRLHAADRRR
jgi:hypothetical protein